MSEKSNNNSRKGDDPEEVSAPLTGRRFHRRADDIHEPEASSQIWLISFTDVMALMLTFFVLLFSMTEPQKQDWSEISSAVRTEFNRFYGSVANRGTQETINVNRIDFDEALNINYLAALIQVVVTESKFLEDVILTPRAGRLVISLPRELLFEPGDAMVKEEGARALYALGGSLSRITNKVEIVGHADPRPISQGEGGYDSNWELSAQRGLTVAGILESVGYQNDIVVRGHSSGRYQDLDGVVDEQQRLDLSRRVDIIVLDHDGSKQKVFLER